MQWILNDPLYTLCEVSDSFMVDRFYLRLQGNIIKVETEGEENDALVSAACALAEQYIAILRKYIPAPVGYGLMTVDEYASVPAWASMATVQRKTLWERALFSPCSTECATRDACLK